MKLSPGQLKWFRWLFWGGGALTLAASLASGEGRIFGAWWGGWLLVFMGRVVHALSCHRPKPT
jgi:hypothetical protein